MLGFHFQLYEGQELVAGVAVPEWVVIRRQLVVISTLGQYLVGHWSGLNDGYVNAKREA